MAAFAYTILYVPDVARSMAFYEAALGLTRKFITPDNSYGELLTGSTTLSFAQISLAQSNLPEAFLRSDAQQSPFGIEIGFTTDNVEATLQTALAAGGSLLAPAKTKPWGQTVAYFRDPDGFLVEVCTEIK